MPGLSKPPPEWTVTWPPRRARQLIEVLPNILIPARLVVEPARLLPQPGGVEGLWLGAEQPVAHDLPLSHSQHAPITHLYLDAPAPFLPMLLSGATPVPRRGSRRRAADPGCSRS